MSRLAVLADPHTARLAGGGASSPDDYAARLVKYIPAETVTFYLLADRLVSAHFGIESPDPHASGTLGAPFVWSLTLLLLALVGTPVYLRRQRTTPHQPWKLHATVSTLAALCWAYAVGGSAFVASGLYDPMIGGIVVFAFTYIAGFFK